MSAQPKSAAKPPVTAPRLFEMKAAGEKIVMLTAYDAGFAAQCEAASVDTVLVGDSLGNVVQGRESTLPVTLDDMVYHTAAVKRGLATPLLIADLPFMTYRDVDTALAVPAPHAGGGRDGAGGSVDCTHAMPPARAAPSAP